MHWWDRHLACHSLGRQARCLSHQNRPTTGTEAGPCILLSEVLVPENEPASGGLVLGHRARDGYFLRKGADLLLVVNKGTVW